MNLGNKIIDELFLTVESVGINTTIKALKFARDNGMEDSKANYIINLVSSITNVDTDRILSGTDRTDERKISLSLSIYFIKNYCDLSFPELKKIFLKDLSALHKYYSIVDSAISEIPKTDFDKSLINYYKKINLSLQQKNK
jgi:chromosomal replication initiation ATPase DnaA